MSWTIARVGWKAFWLHGRRASVLFTQEFQTTRTPSLSTPWIRRGSCSSRHILRQWTSILFGLDQSWLLVFVHIQPWQWCYVDADCQWSQGNRSGSNYRNSHDRLGSGRHVNFHQRRMFECQTGHWKVRHRYARSWNGYWRLSLWTMRLLHEWNIENWRKYLSNFDYSIFACIESSLISCSVLTNTHFSLLEKMNTKK